IDRAVGSDERDRAQVADDAVLGDREIRLERGDREIDRARHGAEVYARHLFVSARRRTSACRSRSVTLGLARRNGNRSLRSITAQRSGVRAKTSAAMGSSSSAEISPKNIPVWITVRSTPS